ncbi:acyltransferase family protein [Flavobacterium psychrolimnae]|nr:acyltransferase [Flavobacterium psychrolimnae]
MKNNIVYLSGLNGLRSIAALSVVISHIAGSINGFNVKIYLFGINKNGLPNGWNLGSNGVTIFFVLSGFLITYLLLLERKKAPISIRKFYIRRVLRIWPVYYMYFFVCILIILSLGENIGLDAFFYYLFFAANIPFVFEFTLPFLAHFWSIGVEEQFYLFWPWLIKKTKQNSFTIILSTVIVINVIRYFLWWKYPFSDSAIFSIVNRFDCMMVGGLGAILFYEKNTFFLKLFDNKITQLLAWIIMILMAFNIKFINSIVDTTIVTAISLILIVGQINVKNRLINLELPFFNFIGKISYGIYVYHMLIIFIFSNLFKYIDLQENYKLFLVYGSVISASIILAYISYEYFEKYFIKLKNNFAVVKSSASRPNK